MPGDLDETRPQSGEGAGGIAGAPKVGAIIADKYRVDGLLGVGGMGVVVAVTHLQLQERYAIKFLLPNAAQNAETLGRFVREARAAVRIKNEHIGRVSDVGVTGDGNPFIVMELLEGSDLGDVLADRGPLPVEDAVEYVLQACEGIAEAHALGIIHRDLKPRNLFLTRRSDGMPFIKVLDFGISKLEDDLAASPVVTDSKAIFGSPAYMSPEQIRSAKDVDARSDVWGLGVILYELLAGRMPFDGKTSGAVLAAISADPPQPLRELRPELPAALEAIVLKCLAKSPADRFQSVAELATELEPFKGEASIASVGRMVRLGGKAAPVSVPNPSPSKSHATAAFAETDAPMTSKVELTGPTKKGVSPLAIGVAAAVVAVVAIAVALRKGEAPPPPPPSVASAPPPSAPSPPPPAPPPPPSASEAPAVASAPLPAPHANPPRVTKPRPRPSATAAPPRDPYDSRQ